MQSIRSVRRHPSAVMAIIVAFFVGSPLWAELKLVRYKSNGQEHEAVGELTVPEEGGRVTLRLFSESLANYYTVYIEPGDVLSHRTLPNDEAAALEAKWESARLAAAAKRKEEKERRRAERKRKEAAAKAREGSKKSRRRSERPSQSKSKGEGKYVGVRETSPDETIQTIDEGIEPLEERLDEVRAVNAKIVGEMRAVASVDRSFRPARALLGEFEGLAEELDEIEERIGKLVGSRNRLVRDVEVAALKSRDVDEKAVALFRLIERYSKQIDEVDASQDALKGRIASVRSAAAQNKLDLAEAASRAAKFEEEQRAKRNARREERHPDRVARSSDKRQGDTTMSSATAVPSPVQLPGNDELVSKATEEPPTDAGQAKPVEKADDSPADDTGANAESASATKIDNAPSDSVDDGATDDDEAGQRAESEGASWVPFLGGFLAAGIIGVFAFAARSASRRRPLFPSPDS